MSLFTVSFVMYSTYMYISQNYISYIRFQRNKTFRPINSSPHDAEAPFYRLEEKKKYFHSINS